MPYTKQISVSSVGPTAIMIESATTGTYSASATSSVTAFTTAGIATFKAGGGTPACGSSIALTGVGCK